MDVNAGIDYLSDVPPEIWGEILRSVDTNTALSFRQGSQLAKEFIASFNSISRLRLNDQGMALGLPDPIDLRIKSIHVNHFDTHIRFGQPERIQELTVAPNPKVNPGVGPHRPNCHCQDKVMDLPYCVSPMNMDYLLSQCTGLTNIHLDLQAAILRSPIYRTNGYEFHKLQNLSFCFPPPPPCFRLVAYNPKENLVTSILAKSKMPALRVLKVECLFRRELVPEIQLDILACLARNGRHLQELDCVFWTLDRPNPVDPGQAFDGALLKDCKSLEKVQLFSTFYNNAWGKMLQGQVHLVELTVLKIPFEVVSQVVRRNRGTLRSLAFDSAQPEAILLDGEVVQGVDLRCAQHCQQLQTIKYKCGPGVETLVNFHRIPLQIRTVRLLGCRASVRDVLSLFRRRDLDVETLWIKFELLPVGTITAALLRTVMAWTNIHRLRMDWTVDGVENELGENNLLQLGNIGFSRAGINYKLDTERNAETLEWHPGHFNEI